MVSHKSNRSRDFQSNKSQLAREENHHEYEQADFKKNKDSPIHSRLHAEEEHF